MDYNKKFPNGQQTLIQPKYHKIQICSKQTPQQIRYLQVSGYWLNMIELPYHPDNQNDQYNQPYKCGEIQIKSEEDNTPEEIKK